MARSPSPAGSSYSRRSRRDDDRYNRRDDRSYRRRSRSVERRYHDRDRDSYRHRRDEDTYRPGQREPSRERKRSRSTGRDRRYRSRDRDVRARRDISRDRDRRRRDEPQYSDSSRKPGRDSRDRQDAKNSTPELHKPKPADEDKQKAEKLAKLEAWKQKYAAEKERKLKEQQTGTRALLEEMDKKATASPAIASPQSPALTPAQASPDRLSSPAPYAGKFDPKAIAKKAAANTNGTTALGLDVAIPVHGSATIHSSTAGLHANKSKVPSSGLSTTLTSAQPLKSLGNVSGFGLGSKSQLGGEKPGSKRALDFGDEQATRKKLEKLPTPPLGDVFGDAALANGVEDDDDDDDDVDIDMTEATEEETAAAARAAAAEKREERLQQDQEQTVDAANDVTLQTDGLDVHMTDAGPKVQEPPVEDEEAEDVDPLDAFMSGLGDVKAPRAVTQKARAGRQQEPEALFSDDEGELNTLDTNPDDILAMATKRKKKEIPTVNHAKINYEDFRKNLYTEPSEMADMTVEELADLRLELDGIKVKGLNVPKPVLKWSQCGLGVQTLEVIQKLGFERPTSVQSQAIPAIMSGRDVVCVAKTGSGKTVAFLLPMFRHIKDQKPLDPMDGPIGLIMTPTRELATQIYKECKPYLKALNLRAVCAYGGAPIKDQIADLKRGAEVIVCTPGRMIDLLAANSGRVTNLRRVTYVVLDEADRMFDMGFEPQVMKITANIRPQRQTVLFSATFPRNMETLARKTLRNPVEIVVGGRSVVAPEITQIVEVRSEETKFIRLLELLGELYDKDEDARTLVFVDRQESADSLLRDLMRKGYPCMSIHGGKDQIDRDSTIDDFKAGVVPIMIATSVAARGLDVKQLKLVVNYDSPNHLEDYVHRAGRTGRAGNTGTAVTFLTEDQERFSLDIAKALRQSGQEVPEAVQKLVDSFIEKVKAGKEKASGSGFGGKGLERLDQERDAARNRERKTFKSGENDEEEEKEDKEDAVMEKIVVKAAGATAAPAPVAIPGVPKGIDLDGKITVHKTEVPSADGGSKNPLDKVAQAVAAIHGKLSQKGQLRQGVPIDNKGPDAGAFHATLEINDFPQKARWAVTNRTNVAKILEATGTSITTKGNFYPPGKEPEAGETPKLYILVEGDTEVVVTNAMRELMRLLKEGTIAAADSDSRAPASGRYSVI